MSHEAEAENRKRRKTSPSVEQYVESIAQLLRQDRVTNVSDIADACGVSRPAASRSVRELVEKGLAEHKAYGYVTLTPEGQALAERLFARHEILRRFIEEVLQFDSDFADLEACRLEHVLEDTLVNRIEKLSGFLLDSPALSARLRKALKKGLGNP